MRSCTGGMMGCGLATMMCVGMHHKMLCEVQRLNPTTNITGIADDTFFNDGRRVHATYECKRGLAWRLMRLLSKLPKVGVYSPIGNADGNLEDTPSYIPGSPHHPDGVLRGGKGAGAFYGDDDWCADKLCKTLEKKLSNLNLVDHIADCGSVTNARQLRFYLMRVVASCIPSHWMRCMMPHVTAKAAAAVDERVLQSFVGLADLDCSPPARKAIASLLAGLRVREGGFDLAAFHDTRHACFLAAYTATRPDLARIYPPSASCSADNPFATAAADTCTHIAGILDAVRERFTTLDMNEYHCVDGVVETDYHPFISDAFEMPPADTMRATPTSKTTRLREKLLVMVAHADRWGRTLDRINDFDNRNHAATVKRREAKRFISVSQTGSGDFLHVTADRAIRGSSIASPAFLSAIQYRVGAYLTALAPVLDERERRGTVASQLDRLGDTAINSSNATPRHNGVNRCVYNARAAVTSATLRLGDKGDGSVRARAEAAKRTEMFNKGHIPDIIEVDAVDSLIETKCWSPIKATQSLGRGSRGKGGAYSENEGSHVGFGGTAEHARHLTFGCKQRGRPGQPQFNHTTGAGYVAEHKGHYHDALSKHRFVSLVLVETTGAVHPDAVGMLHAWHNESRIEGHADRTVYGKARTATSSYFKHHLRLISLAAVIGTALPTLRWAKAAKSQLVRDVTLIDFLPIVM